MLPGKPNPVPGWRLRRGLAPRSSLRRDVPLHGLSDPFSATGSECAQGLPAPPHPLASRSSLKQHIAARTRAEPVEARSAKALAFDSHILAPAPDRLTRASWSRSSLGPLGIGCQKCRYSHNSPIRVHRRIGGAGCPGTIWRSSQEDRKAHIDPSADHTEVTHSTAKGERYRHYFSA